MGFRLYLSPDGAVLSIFLDVQESLYLLFMNCQLEPLHIFLLDVMFSF